MARSFLVVYRGTINANATAPADPVDQNIAIAAVRFNPPIHCYEPTAIAVSGVAPGPRTTSFPINASFALTEVAPQYVDANEPPIGYASWYSFRSGEFEMTYEYEDQDGVTHTGSSPRRIGVWSNPGGYWRAYGQDGFSNFIYAGWAPPPVELPGNRLRWENLRTPADGANAPSASGGHAVIPFQ